jgi:23S rRNA (pseudouridine1915-N3)-methyltransferase
MRLIAVGRLKTSPESEIFDRYNERLRPRLEVTEIPEASGTAAEIKRRESESILNALSPGAFAVALDLGAPAPSSEAFAALLESWRIDARRPAFLIGGAEGLAASVIDRANHILSLGPLTWPHFLVRALLAEQLYRAQTIAAGHPYHRPGRP